jgi:hypothetical protein
MTPVALVAYQSGLTVLVTAQEAPEDVTGAAGGLDGGCAGGASWCADGAEDGELALDAGGWLAEGLLARTCPGAAVLACTGAAVLA